MSTRLLGPKRQKSLFGWHQTLAWTGLSMLGLHAGALLFDPTLHFGLPALLVPFAAPWRPVAVAAGVITGLADARDRLVVPAAQMDRPEGLAAAALRDVRRVLPRPRSCARRGTDLKGVGGPILAAVAAGPVIWLGLARVLMPRAPARAARRPSRPAAETRREARPAPSLALGCRALCRTFAFPRSKPALPLARP